MTGDEIRARIEELPVQQAQEMEEPKPKRKSGSRKVT